METELKFYISDFSRIWESMEPFHPSCSGWYFEQNLVLDKDQDQLLAKDFLLRIRSARKNTLTLKMPPLENSGCKQREELETEVIDFEETERIFSQLGYKARFRYEKFRNVCALDQVKVCLDILPFDAFVELEGPEKELRKATFNLGLDPEQGTAKTYHELHQKYLKNAGLKPRPDFVFTREQKKALSYKLNVKL